MVFEMKLNDEPFQKIKSGSKTIELRLYDEKRRSLKLGDYIIFSRVSNTDDKIAVKVKGLYRSNSFRGLFEDIPLEICGNSSGMTIDDVIVRLRKYYSEEDELRYGVLGIKMELFDLDELRNIEEELATASYDYYFPDGMK
mgnify:CR=1 FL=1